MYAVSLLIFMLSAATVYIFFLMLRLYKLLQIGTVNSSLAHLKKPQPETENNFSVLPSLSVICLVP